MTRNGAAPTTQGTIQKVREEPGLPPIFCETEQVADPLNLMVPLSVFEKRILGCPEMQRLRHIKQLGFVNLVYPAAEYSRFVHSIGVCHQAKRMVDKINENLNQDERYRSWRAFGKYNGEGVDPARVRISNIERVVISAAALLHDLPHAAFSHEIEGVPVIGGEGSAVPSHDDVDENPAFFQYLFNTEFSTLARLILKCNAQFMKALKERKEWVDGIQGEEFSEAHIQLLLRNGAIGNDGLLPIRPREDKQAIVRFRGELQNVPDWARKLPLLGVMLFEIHLFEKQHQWLNSEEQRTCFGIKRNRTDEELDANEQEVQMTWDEGATLLWKPIPGWFRAYRHDIICDTICADLIDYVKRDGYHTGIVSEMDLKFLDRMVIAKGVLPVEDGMDPAKGKPSGHVIEYSRIPHSCEHVVFDVYDHKRGFLRQSVFTEVLAYLQARYLLCERVYGHRVVEGARAMLQRMGGLLASASEENVKLTICKLHPLLCRSSSSGLQPGDDLSLIRWVQSLEPEGGKIGPERESLEEAQELATLLEERRIFREAVIIDGVHGFSVEPPGGPEEACRRLANAFLPVDDAGRSSLEKLLKKIDARLRQEWESVHGESDMETPKVTCMMGVHKWDKRYKAPLVLTADPSHHDGGDLPGIDILPLSKRENPKNIEKQLDAIHTSYNTLWRAYLFVHPVFHAFDFRDALAKDVEELVLGYANNHTGIKWKNAINFMALLHERSEELDIQAYLTGTKADGRVHEYKRAKSVDDNEVTIRLIDSIQDGIASSGEGSVEDGAGGVTLERFKAVYLQKDGKVDKRRSEFRYVRGLVAEQEEMNTARFSRIFVQKLAGEPLTADAAAKGSEEYFKRKFEETAKEYANQLDLFPPEKEG